MAGGRRDRRRDSQWKMAGLSHVQAQATASSPAVVLQFGGERVLMEGLDAEASVELSDAVARWTVRRLKLDAPRLTAAGALAQSVGATDLQLHVEDADFAAVHALGDRLGVRAFRVPGVPERVEAGTITALSVRTSAASLDRLFELPTLEINGAVEQVRLFLPDYALRLEEMRARVTLSGGEWSLEQIEARLGQSFVREGRLTGKLNVTPAPLHAEALVTFDLGETLALAKRIVRDPQTRSELARVQALQGTAQARVVLGDTLERLEPRLDVSAIQANGRHAAIPMPIRISSGRLGYAARELWFDRVEGALGESSFRGVTGRLQLAGSHRLEVRRADAELAMDELFRWLKSRRDLASALQPLRTLSGAASVSVTRLEGGLRDPDALAIPRIRASAASLDRRA